MQSQLDARGVQVSSVRLSSSFTANDSLTFEVILSAPPEQQTPALVEFSNYISSMLLTFGGVPVRDGNRGILGITRTCKLLCWKYY